MRRVGHDRVENGALKVRRHVLENGTFAELIVGPGRSACLGLLFGLVMLAVALRHGLE